jgi:NitT/TauT family transport system permease protein
MKKDNSLERIISIFSILVLILLWKIASLFYDSEFILPSPDSVILTTFQLIIKEDFINVVGATIFRGLIGFTISFILGISLGILAGINKYFYSFLNPILVTMRSIPVISFILLALIWFQIDFVAIFIAFLTMFPFICTNVIEGIKNVDENLIEMSRIYKVNHAKIILEIYLPAITPFIFSGALSAMGFGWRAIIIGEVLSQPRFGIGTLMQTAQSYLLVNEVIAWTVIAIAISYLFELLIRRIEKLIVNWK